MSKGVLLYINSFVKDSRKVYFLSLSQQRAFPRKNESELCRANHGTFPLRNGNFSVHFLRHHLHFARAQNNTLVIFRPEKCFQLENQHTLHPQKYVKTNYL